MNCKNCGAVLNSNDLFCQQCGQPVNNESNNTQNQTIQGPYTNSNSSYKAQDYQPNQQYNNYNNTSNNSSVGRIILIIVLAIVFWAVGFGLGKLIWGNDKDTNITNPQVSEQGTSETNNQSNKNQNSSVTNNNTNKNENSNQTNNQNRSYIVTDYGMKVYFDVANTLKEDTSGSSDEEYRCFEKIGEDDDLIVWVGEEYATMNEYMSDIEDKANRRKQNSEYSNVQLSEVKTKNVNGKNFLLRSLTYNMGDTEFKDLYIAYEIASESLYAIEIEEYQLLTDEELDGLLNITIER